MFASFHVCTFLVLMYLCYEISRFKAKVETVKEEKGIKKDGDEENYDDGDDDVKEQGVKEKGL